MPFVETGLKGLLFFEPALFTDNRGCFFESYSEKVFANAGIVSRFVQDNESHSVKGVIRGLHYQLAPYAQAKLVRVVKGEVLDVAVDLRKDSPTFGKSFAALLSADNKKQLFIPHGFAHGFSVLSDECIFQYKCDNYYSKENEAGIIYNDPELNINWGFDLKNAVVSDKDMSLPSFSNCVNNFVFQP